MERFGKVKAGKSLNKQIAEAKKPDQHGDADAHDDQRQKVGSKVLPKRVLFVCHFNSPRRVAFRRIFSSCSKISMKMLVQIEMQFLDEAFVIDIAAQHVVDECGLHIGNLIGDFRNSAVLFKEG